MTRRKFRSRRQAREAALRTARGRGAQDDVNAQLVALLREQLEDLRRRLDGAERERAELGRLLAMSAGTLAEVARRLSALDPAPAVAPAPPVAEGAAGGSARSTQFEPEAAAPEAAGLPATDRAPAGRLPRLGKAWRIAGAALGVLGAAAILAGIGLGIAIHRQVIGGRGHLEYVVGLVGLLVLLIGLALAR